MTTAEHQAPAKGWTADDSTFGARLALIRQRMGWGNVKEAAVACGLPPESWRTWERDGVAPRRLLDVAAVIADRTGCDYGWLLAGQRLQGVSPQAIARYLTPPVRTTEPRSRPRDNRPPGHPVPGTTPGVRRTAHLPRTGKAAGG